VRRNCFSRLLLKSSTRESGSGLLASKLESLYKKLMEECIQTMHVIDLVDTKLKQGTPPKQIYDDNEDKLRSVWSESNEGEILVSLYFPELMDSFRDFRSTRSEIGTIFRHLATAPFADAVGAAVMPVGHKMTDAYNVLRQQMARIASTICPRKRPSVFARLCFWRRSRLDIRRV